MSRWFATLGLLAACGDSCGPSVPSQGVAGPPRGATAANARAPELSTIVVPITLPIDALRAQVLQKVPKVLVDTHDEPMARGVLGNVHVERTDQPEVVTGQGELRIEVPVKAHVRVRPDRPPLPGGGPPTGLRGKVGPRGPGGGPPEAEVDAALRVIVRLRPEVAPDWSLQPHVEVSHQWVSTPVIHLGPIAVDIGDRADPKIREKLAQAAADIERDVAADIDLAAKVSEAWTALGSAQSLQEAPPTWLRFAPEALFLSPLKLDRSGLHVIAGAAGLLEIVVAPEAPTVIRQPLPGRTAPPAHSGARVAAQLRVDWHTLRDTLAQQLEGHSVPYALPTGGEGTVKLAHVRDVYPSGEAIAVGVDLVGAAGGAEVNVTLWLTGRPAVQDDAIRILDFAYAADSDRALVDLAHEALSDRVRAAVSERLFLPLAEPRAQLLQQVNGRLATPPPGRPARFTGAVTRADLVGVTVSDEALVVDAVLVGELSVTVRELPPR